MNKINLFVLFIAVMVVSCKPKSNEMPTTIPELKSHINALKKQSNDLKAEIQSAEAKMRELDPAYGEVKKKLVEIDTIGTNSFQQTIAVQGTILSDQTAIATPEIPGRIVSMRWNEGDYIKKGAVVATLDLDQIEKQKAELQKAMELAKDVYERQKRLWDQQIGSELQYLEAKNNMERLQKSMESLDFQSSKKYVYAPISGSVEGVMTEEGELASPGMPILQIMNTAKLKVKADVPEDNIRHIKRGKAVTVEIPALDFETTARIGLVGRTLDAANRTISIEIPISSKGGLVKPNLLSVVNIPVSNSSDVISLPFELIQQEVTGGYFVMVADSQDGRWIAVKRKVMLGNSYDDRTIIDTGLEKGDLLITEGARRLSEGDFIEIAKN